MTSLFYLLLIVYFVPSILTDGLFSIQETLTVVCQQFPLVSTVNNSDLQCARLRIDENVPTSVFELNEPTQIYLFAIIDLSSFDKSSVDITVDFNPVLDTPTSINEIRLGLLVTGSNFTINNQTTTEYSPYDIPIFRWENSVEKTYDLVDLIPLENKKYDIDKTLCKWDISRWNRLFNGNTSNNVSYAYLLKTANPQLTFTIINTNNISSSSSFPSLYLNILYCIPYKLGVTEMVLIICCSVFFIIIVVILGISHYFKGGDDNRTRHFERYYHHHRRDVTDRSIRNSSKLVRYRSSASIPSVEQDDQHT